MAFHAADVGDRVIGPAFEEIYIGSRYAELIGDDEDGQRYREFPKKSQWPRSRNPSIS